MKKNEVIVHHGADLQKMAQEICEAARLDEMIGEPNKKVGLKPNLVNQTTADRGATTHPEIAEGVIVYLKGKGYRNISIIEGSCAGDNTTRAFKVCGYEELRRKYSVELIDTQKDKTRVCDCMGVPIHICESALGVDFMVNMPVMKGHCQTTITCALKNNKGLIPDSEKRRFHSMGLHKPIAHLNTAVRNDFILVDAICGDLDFEEGGNPVPMNRIMGFADPVLCDAYVCGLLGHSITEVSYIGMASALGIGSSDVQKAEVIYLSEGKSAGIDVKFTKRVGMLARKVNAKDACSACYGSLIHALDKLRRSGIEVGESICVGQGYRSCGNSQASDRVGSQEDSGVVLNKECIGKLGIGSCTGGFEKSLKGCPPKAIDIIDFLKGNVGRGI